MKIGDCLFYLRPFCCYCFWYMRKLQGSNICGFLCLQASKRDRSYVQLCSIFLCIAGQGKIHPSMYSLNILLCNKDYKTSKYYSQMSILYRHITQGINYTGFHVHTEGKIPRGLAFSAHLEAPLETSLTTLGRQKQLLTLFSVDGQPPLPYVPCFVFVFLLSTAKTFFHVLCILHL